MRSRSLHALLPVALAAAAFACADQLATAPAAPLVRPSLDVAARTEPRALQINEFHYDNDGTDAGEFIELLGPAGASLDGWKVVLYNGSGGAEYHTRALTATDALGADLGGACAGEGAFVIDYPSNGIQNGSPDGIALVRPDGSVAEFLSYEGAFTATTGPATGLAATPIAAQEPGTTPLGQSLQRDATTNAWPVGPAAATRSLCNAGGAEPPPPPPPPPTRVVVISEVMANPAGLDTLREWFELHNPGAAPLDVQGWTLSSNSGSHTIAAATVIPAGGYALLARNGDAATNGGLPAIAYVYPGASVNLSNANGWLRIRTADGATADSVAWATSTDASSRALGDLAADNADMGGTAWFTSAEAYGLGGNGTPGAANGAAGGGLRISVVGRTLSDPALPVGFQDQLFATLRDENNAELPSTFTWSTTTPALLAIDANGVVTALGEGDGSVTVRANETGVERTWRVPTIVATASATADYEGNAEFGEPADGTAGDDFIIRRDQYTSSYNVTLGTPNWVAYNLEDSHIGSSFDRCDCFTPEPTLPSGAPTILTSDYTGSGYSRGHLTKSADRTAGTLDNAVTFYFSNIIPQTAANNGGPWLALENWLSDLADDQNREVYVVAGRAGSLGTLKGEGKVSIPASVWKVAIVMDRDEGLDDVDGLDDFELVAINVPNASTVPGAWQDYVTTVDAIEALTGYDLLALLPDRIERIVESGTRSPVANAGGPYVALEDEAVRLDGSASSDPDGDAITHAWSFGDGATGTGATPSHAYAAAGTFTATLTVADPYGAEGVATATVTVRTRQALLADLVAYVNAVPGLASGNRTALVISLRTAIAALDRGDAAAAVDQLQSFMGKVSDLSAARRLSPAAAARMTTDAGRVIASIRAN